MSRLKGPKHVEFKLRSSVLRFANDFMDLSELYIEGAFTEVLKLKRQPNVGVSRKRVGKSTANESFRNFAMISTKTGWSLCYLPYGPYGEANIGEPAIAYKFFNGNYCALQFANKKWRIYHYEMDSYFKPDGELIGDSIWQSELLDDVRLPEDSNRKNRFRVKKDNIWFVLEKDEFWKVDSAEIEHDVFKYPKTLLWYKDTKDLPLVRMDKALKMLNHRGFLSSYYYDLYFLGNIILDVTKKHIFTGFSLDLPNCRPYVLYLKEHVKQSPFAALGGFSKDWKEIKAEGCLADGYHRLFFLSDTLENPLSPRSLGFQTTDAHRYMYMPTSGKLKYFGIKGDRLTEFPKEFANGSPFSPYLDWTLVYIAPENIKKYIPDIQPDEYSDKNFLAKYWEDGHVERYIPEPDTNTIEELVEVTN